MKRMVLLAILFLASCAQGQAATITSRSGARANVSLAMYSPAQCLVNRIDASGHRIRYMRGFGRGTVRGSLHPAGNALDIDQSSRNRANLPRAASAWAQACGLVSGASWRGSPDFGHFQLGGWTGRSFRRHWRHR